MALTSPQKMIILRLLCYPLGTINTASVDFSNIINDRLTAISGDAQTEVEKVLEWIDETEVQIDSAITAQRVKRVDDIEFFEDQSSLLAKTKARYVRDLATMIGITSRCRGGMGNVIV